MTNHESERHTKVDQFVCPGCHKTFASLRALAQHSKSYHNGVRRFVMNHFQCWMCGGVSEVRDNIVFGLIHF
jgi:transposase-like protein